ncbi:hypothetical protein ACFSCX_07695 [Bacillus salitolerans]|uniref:Uncharacterized protein n=1 Tax=Bacillus salitolerans TaxID=1437434 RepID=A0ABW4LMR0_9BACI
MKFFWRDIDQLLDDTTDIAKECSCFMMKEIDIDQLLKHTEHWMEYSYQD